MVSPETVIISVGGSMIVPDGIDTQFLTTLREHLTKETEQGSRFVLISGGGKTSRRYAEALKAVRNDISNDDLDWLGIHATRLNGHLLRAVFFDVADPVMYTNPETVPSRPEFPITIAAGFRPGASTDYVAVSIAKHIGATRMVNLSNIDYAYTADPRIDPTATPNEKIDWPAFRKLIPDAWDPGLSSPFDPVAAKEAQSIGLEVAIIHGKQSTELKKYLAGDDFKGTRIM